MLLILHKYLKINTIYVSSLIIYISVLLSILFINYNAGIFFILVDIYIYLISTNFNMIVNKNISLNNKIKMEIVAEGSTKIKNTDLTDIMMEYQEKFNE